MEYELEDDDTDDQGVVTWLLGMVPCGGDRWNELVAAHTVKGDAPEAERDAAHEAFEADVVANTVRWEKYGDEPRTDVTPGDVAQWPDTTTPDVWAAIVEDAIRVSGPKGWEWATERLRRAPLLQVEMSVCREYRIPRSEFLRWSEDDRHLAIAELVDSRSACTGCGVPDRGRLNPDAAQLVVDGCFWCGLLADARREAGDEQHPRIQLKPGY